MTEPEIQQRPALPYLGIAGRITDGVPAFVDRAFPELFGWLRKHALEPAGAPFIRYRELDTAGERLVGWAEQRGLVYSRQTDRGSTLPCCVERYLVGPVDEPDFTKWETEFAYLVL